MSGRGRLAVCGAVATLAASLALLPLVDPAVWILQLALLLTGQTLVGALARRVPLPRPVTPLLQAAVTLLALTFFFVRNEAVGGLLPGPDAFAQFGQLLAQGSHDVGRYAIPAPLTDGIRLMLVGGITVIGLLVDALAVTFRSAAPAGLPLLALYSVAAGLARDGAAWPWFLCAAGGYLLLLLAEGRERLAQWGRVFTDRGRPGSPSWEPGAVEGPAAAPARTGRRIGAATLGLALLVPALLPSLEGGLLDATRGGAAAGQGGGTVSAVNPLVALQDSLNQAEDRTALVYRTNSPRTQEMYLRIVALDQFDGASWKPSERRIDAVPDPLPAPPGLSPEVPTKNVRSDVVAAEWYAQNWLPMPYPANRVQLNGRWRFEPEGRTLVGDRGQTTRGVRYQVDSLLVEPTARQLRQAPDASGPVADEYTRVPRSLPPVVHRTAQKVTRGARTDYMRAVRLQDWFASDGGFTYDTRVRAGSGGAAIANFLEQKEGFCIHFAFSMAAMARTLDVPARVAVGFTPGTARADGRMDVGLKDAHAWPELYFEGVGWTRFEPTPTRGTPPPYAQPEEGPSQDDGPAEQLPDRGQSDAPAPQPSASDECDAAAKRLDPQCGGAAPAPDRGDGEGGLPVGTVAAVAVPLLGLVLLTLPMLWRLRARARRLRDGPAAGDDPGGAVLAGWRELVDSGWDFGVVPEESATPRKAAERLVRIGDLGPEAAEAAYRVALEVEQVLYAPRPRPGTGMRADVLLVRAALREAAPRGLRLRALLLPPSSVRALWAVTRGATGLRDRWARTLRVRFAK